MFLNFKGLREKKKKKRFIELAEFQQSTIKTQGRERKLVKEEKALAFCLQKLLN